MKRPLLESVRLAQPKLVLQLLDRPNHITYGGSRFQVGFRSGMADFAVKKLRS